MNRTQVKRAWKLAIALVLAAVTHPAQATAQTQPEWQPWSIASQPLSRPLPFSRDDAPKLSDQNNGLARIAEPPKRFSLQLQVLDAGHDSRPVTSKAPDPFPSFNSHQMDQQLQQYLRYVSNFGAPDILIVGSSRALWGIDPIVLQHTLGKRGYPNLRIYNFGINGATAQVVDVVLRRLIPPDQLPRLIIWADGSRAFNSGRRDRTYENLVASEGYRLLLAGVRPVPPEPKVVEIGEICTDFIAPILGFFAALGMGEEGWVTPPLACAKEAVIMVQARQSPHISAEILRAYQGTAGFEPLSTRFNPTTYFQRYPRVAGIYDGDYQAFNLEGRQANALRQTLNYVRSHGTPVVYVNLPLHRIYLDPTRTTYEIRFRQFMQRFANHGLLTFYDLTLQWQTQNHYYVDPSHLNQYGAATVAESLGKRLVLPPARNEEQSWL